MLEKIPSMIGKALSGVRPGVEATLARKTFAAAPGTMTVRSIAFAAGQPLPADCTEDGPTRQSPPLAGRGVPPGTAKGVLIGTSERP